MDTVSSELYIWNISVSRPWFVFAYVLYPDVYDHYSSKSKHGLMRVCMVPNPRKKKQKPFFPQVLFPISCQAGNGWVEFANCYWITHQCHTRLCHWWWRRGIAAQQREKQTGLQGDREDFWGWNQCAYYETGRLNRLDDELRAWWSTVITGKLWTSSMQTLTYNT